jgi:hypothetical protein
MPPIKGILEQLIKEGTTIEQLTQANREVFLGEIDIPTGVSVESVIKEVEQVSARLIKTYNANPADAIALTKITTLLEMKMKILGMNQVKPEMQDIIDSEVNNYKKKFLTIASSVVDKPTMLELGNKLAAEGL